MSAPNFIEQFLPSQQRFYLAIGNFLRKSVSFFCKNRSSHNEEKFRVVLCWLEFDKDGSDTTIVANALTSIPGIKSFRSGRVIKASGAKDEWEIAMHEDAQKTLKAWNADVIVTGRVKKSKETLDLWAIQRKSEGALTHADRRPCELKGATLQEDFHDDFQAQLTIMVLDAVAPFAQTKMRRQVLNSDLESTIRKLEALVESSPPSRTEHQTYLNYHALGAAFLFKENTRKTLNILNRRLILIVKH